MEPTSDASTIDETADVTVGHSRVRRSSGSDTRIRAACGTVVRCSEGASRLSGFVKRWLDEPGEALTDDGPERLFQLQPDACISAETLRCLVNELEHTATRVVAGRNDQATGARETSMHFATLPMVDFFALHRAARFLECEHLELHLALHLASRLCGKTPQQIRKVFSIAGDLSDQRQRDSPSESVLTPPTDPRPGTAAPGGALACGAPQLARSLSLELGDEGAIFDCLGAADVQTVITLKGVSLAWRERARIALTDVACSSWRASAAVRGEAGGRLELRMIELHQQQALARVDASVNEYRLLSLPPTLYHTLPNRKGIDQRPGAAGRLLEEWRGVAETGRAKDDIDCHLLSISPVGDLCCFHAELLGQQGTPYAGGVFKIELELTADYPMHPPAVRFVTPICHPNIERLGGKVCFDFLQKEWSPAYTIRAICRIVSSLLADPNFDALHPVYALQLQEYWLGNRHKLQVQAAQHLTHPSVGGSRSYVFSAHRVIFILPVEPELAALFREDPGRYEQQARDFTREHAWPGKY